MYSFVSDIPPRDCIQIVPSELAIDPLKTINVSPIIANMLLNLSKSEFLVELVMFSLQYSIDVQNVN